MFDENDNMINQYYNADTCSKYIVLSVCKFLSITDIHCIITKNKS